MRDQPSERQDFFRRKRGAPAGLQRKRLCVCGFRCVLLVQSSCLALLSLVFAAARSFVRSRSVQCAFSPAACDWLELLCFLLVIVNMGGPGAWRFDSHVLFCCVGGVVGMWLFCEAASTKGWRKELPLQERVLVLGSGIKVAGLGGGRREGWGRRRGG